MTITAQTSKTGPYNGNGTTTVFSYTFEVQDEAHLVVTLADASGVETVQVLNTDYTVSGVGNAGGGQITMSTAPVVGYTLTISRNIPITQEVDLENRRSVAPEVLEDAYDKLTQIAQDLSEQVGRAIKISVTEGGNPTLTLQGDVQANTFLGFDASGNLAQLAPASGTFISPSAAIVAVDDFTGDGTTVNFTLGGIPQSPNNLFIFLDGVMQDAANYTVSGTTLTFTTAPPLNTNIEVRRLQAVALTGGTTADLVTYSPAGTGAQDTTVQAKLREFVSVKDFGAVGDGVTDDTAAIQAAIDAASLVEFPSGNTFVTSGNTIGSNKTLVIDGTVLLKAASPAGTKMFANSDQVGGNTNITILGVGTLDGNKANQTGTTDTVWHTLVDIENCDYFEFAVAKITGNYFPISVSSGNTTGAVYVRNSDYVKVHDSLATDYGREAFWCESCNYSQMFNLRAVGGASSWSGMQQSGDYCNSSNWYGEAAGASGASFDCRYSSLSNVVIKDNTVFNGLNCGHNGIPADGSTISNISIEGAAQNGINIAANTVDLSLSGFNIKTTVGEGVNISDGANRINIADGVIDAAGSDAINIFATGTVSNNTYNVSGVTVISAGGYAVRADACSVMVNGVVGNGSSGSIGRFNSAIVYPTGCWFDRTAFKFGFQDISGLGAGGSVTINNTNVTASTLVNVEASNVQGAAANPYISAINDNSFVISTEFSGASGAGCRWWIG